MTIKRSKIPTILGLVLLIAATFAGVFFINSRQIFRIGAGGESEPNDVRVSNITDSSLTISWTTDKESVGFIVWNKGATQTGEKGYTQLVTLSGLEAGISYKYKINSNGAFFDNNGVPWQATTSLPAQAATGQTVISGSVLTATGQPVKKALVYINITGVLFSTLTSDSGNYVVQLPDVYPISTLLEIFVQAGPMGVSSAQIYPQAAKPVPPMILGSTHDFKSLTPAIPGDTPEVSLNLPEGIDEESKFDIQDLEETPASLPIVTLESVDEGETVTSTQPEFFGDGPKGTELTIKIESENPITDKVGVDNDGFWNWNPPEDLAPGPHKITITWKDLSGITRNLTRNFVVQAGEAPAFEASGSATTQTPSPTPKATTTAKATPTQSVLPTSVPETGSLTPTILLSIMGVGIMSLSFAIWKYAQSI